MKALAKIETYVKEDVPICGIDSGLVSLLEVYGEYLIGSWNTGLDHTEHAFNFLQLTDNIIAFQRGRSTTEEYDEYVHNNLDFNLY